MASLDVQRPAAREQLRVLGEQTEIFTLPIVKGETVKSITKRAMVVARLQGYDFVLLDTAGRISVSSDMMQELRQIRDQVEPAETLLVADALTGQDAVVTAQNFHEQVGLTGIVLTRMDGDSRGGAALSMRAVTGVPIKAVGTGEKTDALEAFHPERVAGNILGMADVVSLVEKAAQTVDQESARRVAARLKDGQFDLDDMLMQLKQMTGIGGVGAMMGLLPGMGKLKKQLAGAGVDDRMIGRQIAIIQSMTAAERRQPKILKASRKRRIAAGSGTSVQDINRLLKQFQQTATIMKQLRRKGGLAGLAGMLGGGGLPAGAGEPVPGLDLPGMPGGGMPGMRGLSLPRMPTTKR